jgi:hypothetical protein
MFFCKKSGPHQSHPAHGVIALPTPVVIDSTAKTAIVDVFHHHPSPTCRATAL